MLTAWILILLWNWAGACYLMPRIKKMLYLKHLLIPTPQYLMLYSQLSCFCAFFANAIQFFQSNPIFTQTHHCCLFCYYLFMTLQCKSHFNRNIHVGVPVGQSWIKQNRIFSTSFCYSTNFPTPNPFNWSPNQSTGPQIHWMCFEVTKSPNWTK